MDCFVFEACCNKERTKSPAKHNRWIAIGIKKLDFNKEDQIHVQK